MPRGMSQELRNAIKAIRCKESGKLKYRYEKDAWTHAAKMYFKNEWDNSGVYVCPFCRNYHLSNKIKGVVPQWVIEELLNNNKE